MSVIRDDSLCYYLAAPYSGHNRKAIEANVAHAVEWWKRLTDAGYFIVLPHASDLQDMLTHQHFDSDFWYAYTMRLMKRCDAVVLIPEGPTPTFSKGVEAEVSEADRIGMPVVSWADLMMEATK